MSTIDLQPGNKTSPLRRSQRVCLRLPIIVFREGPGTNVASEETSTLTVSAHGALIRLALKVEIGQRLRIKNAQTTEHLVCRVVNLGPEYSSKQEVAVEFEAASPRFWRIAFPPADWTPRNPDAKPLTAHKPGGNVPLKKLVGAPPEADKKLVTKSGGSS